MTEFVVTDRGIRIVAIVQLVPANLRIRFIRLIWGAVGQQRCQDVVPNAADELSASVPRVLTIREELPLVFNYRDDWSSVRAEVHWNDGTQTILHNSSDLESGFLADLNFSKAEQFYNKYQNPAFRSMSPAVQAYGARRAMAIAGGDKDLWLSGAVVAIYRCILDDVYDIDQVREILRVWEAMQVEELHSARSIRLRWCTSMHLAAGYAHLCLNELEQAIKEFSTIENYWERMETWPQSLTNFGIARLLSGLLLLKDGELNAARGVFRDSENRFPHGCKTLNIWNYSMFEELRGALRVWQYNFTLMKKLQGESREYIVPPDFRVALSHVSATLEQLIRLGKIDNWICGSDVFAKLLASSCSGD